MARAAGAVAGLRAYSAKGPGEEQRGMDETGKGFHGTNGGRDGLLYFRN